MSEEKVNNEEIVDESTQKEYNIIFVSGNIDMDEKKYLQYYYYPMEFLLQSEEPIHFVLSDDDGCAAMTQVLLKQHMKENHSVSIFGCGDDPVNYVDQRFVYVGGFQTLEERDAAMTFISNKDLHVVLEGKGRSAVEHNVIRRVTPEYDYEKYKESNVIFWQPLISKLNESDQSEN